VFLERGTTTNDLSASHRVDAAGLNETIGTESAPSIKPVFPGYFSQGNSTGS
jgi:hypothetical protein